MLNRLPLYLKMISIVFVGMIGMTVTAWFGLQTLQENMRLDRELQTRNLIHSAVTAVRAHYNAAEAGELSEEQAQELALDVMRTLRYGQEDYFFVFEREPILLAHGWRPQLEGEDLSALDDANGFRFIEAMVQGALRRSDEPVYYSWARDENAEPVEKLAFAELFEPWGWVIGTGVDVDDVADKYNDELIETLIIGLVVAVAMAATSLLLWHSVSGPISQLSGAMRRLARGEHHVDIPARNWKNEVGMMAATVQVFKEQAIAKVRLEEEQREKEERAEQEKRELMARLADGFEGSVGGIVRAVSSSATEMESTSQSMSSISEDANRQSANVAAAAQQAATNVETVAAAAEELGGSITEISRQVQQQRTVATIASDAAAKTNGDIGTLAERADKIGEVIGLITGIAEQTNLLALNATIEAARAGEAGKGFAVVASEVKNLANQTSKATEDIADQIRSMQDQTGRTVSSISTITAKIDELNEISSAVAAAVEQQNAATQEIARNANEAAAGTGQVTRSIDAVSRAASEAGGAAGEVLTASGDLSRHATQLTEEVHGFLRSIRAV